MKYYTKAQLSGIVLLLILAVSTVVCIVKNAHCGRYVVASLFGFIGFAMAFLGYGSNSYCDDCMKKKHRDSSCSQDDRE
jgi:hypothetical protein